MNEEIKKKAWPTKEAMEQVYDLKLWGNNGSNFYSGDGSHNPDIVRPYIEVVTTFLQSTEHQLVVCDLGCGDFNLMKHFNFTGIYFTQCDYTCVIELHLFLYLLVSFVPPLTLSLIIDAKYNWG